MIICQQNYAIAILQFICGSFGKHSVKIYMLHLQMLARQLINHFVYVVLLKCNVTRSTK